jgi:hypothetical protein
MLFWILTLQAHLLDDWALPVTAGLINTASIVGVVVLAHRRGGLAFMFATAVALVAMCGSLAPETWHDIFNPWIVLLPFTLLLFLGWSVACGEYRLLPLTVVVASFVLQTHFSVGPPTIGVLLVALSGLVLRARVGDGDRKRWLLGALITAVVCWSAPLIDQAVHRPGNIARIVQSATAQEPNVAMSSGWHALARAVGVWPWWLREPLSSTQRVFEVGGPAPTLAIVSCVLVLLGLAIAGVLGLRHRRPDVTAAAAIGLVVSVAIMLVIVSTPARLAFHIDKATRWTSPAGMFIWLVLCWSLATLLPRRLRSGLAVSRPLGALAGLTITAVVAVGIGRQQEPDQFQSTYRPVHTITSRLEGHLSDQHPVLIASAGSFDVAFALQMAVIYRLRQEGYNPVTLSSGPLAVLDKLGAGYSPKRHPPREAVLIDDRGGPAPFSDARVIARVRVPGKRADPASLRPASPSRTITVSILPATRLL